MTTSVQFFFFVFFSFLFFLDRYIFSEETSEEYDYGLLTDINLLDRREQIILA